MARVEHRQGLETVFFQKYVRNLVIRLRIDLEGSSKVGFSSES
jgi:hypothetical protein